MRVLMVTSRYLPHRGGLETVVRQLSRHLKADGHALFIVTNRYPNSLPKSEIIDGITVKRLQMLYPRLSYLTSGRLDLWVAGLAYFPLTLIHLLAILFRFRPDVVNLHYLGSPGLFLWLLHHLIGFRLIVSLHGGDVDAEPYRNRFNRWLFRALLRRACIVTACSRSLLTQAIALESSIENKTFVLHNGVEKDVFAEATSYTRERPYILAVGQLVPHKGFDFLIRVFSGLAAGFPGVDLLIAGEGPVGATLQTLVEEMNLDNRVVFVGKVGVDEVAALMKGSLLVAVPSFREPFGIVVLEAMAAGRPVLATRVGGIPEFADTPCNRLVVAEEDLWAEALRAMLQKSLVSRKSCQANKLAASQYEWSVVAKRYLTLYELDRLSNAESALSVWQ